MGRILARAIAVHAELMRWGDTFNGGLYPGIGLRLEGIVISLWIGAMCVWNSEDGYDDEQDHDAVGESPSFAGCVACYKSLIEDLSAWPE